MPDDRPGRIGAHPSLNHSGFRSTPQYIEELRLRQLRSQAIAGRGRPGGFDALMRLISAAPKSLSQPTDVPRRHLGPSGCWPSDPQTQLDPDGPPVGPRGPLILRG